MFILKFLDHDCWIAAWDGDPGRTLIKKNARVFYSVEDAERFKKKTIKNNNHRKFDLIIESLEI